MIVFLHGCDDFLNSPLPFPDVVHSYGELDAGVVWEFLDDNALFWIDLEVHAANLLVERVYAVHQLLDYLGVLRLLDDTSFDSGVDLITRKEF